MIISKVSDPEMIYKGQGEERFFPEVKGGVSEFHLRKEAACLPGYALLNSYYHLPGYFRKTSVNSMSYQATAFLLVYLLLCAARDS